jgi:hypothetical protein
MKSSADSKKECRESGYAPDKAGFLNGATTDPAPAAAEPRGQRAASTILPAGASAEALTAPARQIAASARKQ